MSHSQQFLATFTALLGVVASGMHYAWPSPSLPQLLSDSSDMHITTNEGSLLSIIVLLGSIAGCVIAGPILNKIGRKWSILITTVPFFVTWIVIAFASSIKLILGARFFAGLADGILFTAIPIYIGEISSPKIRGLLSSSISSTWVLGMLFINWIGSFLSIRRTALISSIVPVLTAITFASMPESPYFLIMKKQDEAAKLSIKRLHGCEDIEVKLNQLKVAVQKNQTDSKSKYLELITNKHHRKAFLLLVLLRTAQQFSGVSALTFYIKLIFTNQASFLPSEVTTLAYCSLQLFSLILSSFLMDKVGRRPLIIFSALCSGIAHFIGATYFYLKEFTAINLAYLAFIPVLTLLTFVVVFNLGLQPIPLVMIGEVFAPNIRAVASSACEIHFNITAAIVSKCFQVLNDYFGIYLSFYLFSLSCIISAGLMYFFMPETKGKSLEEIQEMFTKCNDKHTIGTDSES